MDKVVAVDLFCGVGGMTHGLIEAGLEVVAGIDIDESCKFPYEKNNQAKFIGKSVVDITKKELSNLYPAGATRILVGCAPCQPFSTYTQKIKNRKKDARWSLLYSFQRLIGEIEPQVVSMENVPQLATQKVFKDFTEFLTNEGYHVSSSIVFCPDYGIPQTRKRLVLLASKLGPINIVPKTHDRTSYLTVKDAIGNLETIKAGSPSKNDRLHWSQRLSKKNKDRIKQSRPGGTWRDWDKHLVADCHKKPSGNTYSSVYARMTWSKPSPTITTQFYSYGTGRFGHPTQNRALSLREGAILQTFPQTYEFISSAEKVSFKKIGTYIGNAVPVRLGAVVGKSIIEHLGKYKVSQRERQNSMERLANQIVSIVWPHKN